MTLKDAKEILSAHRPDRPRKTEDRQFQKAIDVILSTLEGYEDLIKSADITVGGIKDKTRYSGCFKCSAHPHCYDAFQPHSIYCNAYGEDLRGKGERKMTCEYCVHVENCLSTGRIRAEEVGEGGCCNEFEYGGLLEHDGGGEEE